MVGQPIASAPFAVPFKTRDVEGRSFLDVVRGKQRPDLATDALQAMLSAQVPGNIYPSEVVKTLKGYGLSGSEARNVLTALWQHALEAFLANDSAISDQETEYLAALQRLFDLGEDDIAPIRDAVVYARYEAVVARAVAGYELNAAAKTVLQRIARQLRLPADVEARIYKSSARLAIAQRLKAVVAKRRASEEEAQGILTLVEELGVPLTTEERNQLAVCYFLTKLDAGELPTANPTVALQRGEICHYVGVAGWSELRKVRSRGTSYDELTLIDAGVIHITDKRLLYTADKRSATVKYTALLGAQVKEQHLLLQKATGKSPYLTFPDELHRELAWKTINRLISGDVPRGQVGQAKPDDNPPPSPAGTPGIETARHPVRKSAGPPRSDMSLKELMGQLNALVGLPSVKSEVASLVNFLRVQRLRADQGLPASPISLHLVFTGNPGTGKTTVARLLAQIFKAMGLLLQGHLVETDRSGLVGGYVGQTALKTQGVAQRALGGVLFIDEAYALTTARESGADYGSEAVDTLLKLMEDNRDNLVVIVAGYGELMNQFLESNPGLRSRFTRFINFPDYDAEELYEIFLRLTAAAHYSMSASAQVRARELFARVHRDRGPHFGNGRLVRNAFERTLVNVANRLETDVDITRADLTTIEDSDLPPAEVLH